MNQKPIQLLDGAWEVEIFLDRSEPGYDDNVFIRISEKCRDNLRLLQSNQITVGITAAQARQLARRLIEIAARDQASAEEELSQPRNEQQIGGALRSNANAARPFTKTQGRYLAFIHYYLKVHRRAPAESELQRHFQVSPPSVHQMIVTLERKGLISRVPGEARSIRLLIPPDQIPALD